MKKIGFIAMALVLALGALGVAFADWTDSVVVTEVVNTGTVCVGIRDIGTNDAGPHGTPGDSASYFEPSFDPVMVDGGIIISNKNVASCDSVDGVYKCDHLNDSFYASVTETIDNAYPGYAPTMTIEVANCGTIPVIASGFDEVVTGDTELNAFTELWRWEIWKDGVLLYSGSGETNLGMAVVGIQIEPCDVVTIYITKHILQDAMVNDVMTECPQGKTVTFTETITFVQWNKFVGP